MIHSYPAPSPPPFEIDTDIYLAHPHSSSLEDKLPEDGWGEEKKEKLVGGGSYTTTN